MGDFSIEITSFPDKENLVAEIWLDERLVAEINQEQKEMIVEFYLNDEGSVFILSDLLEIMEKAEKRLREMGRSQ